MAIATAASDPNALDASTIAGAIASAASTPIPLAASTIVGANTFAISTLLLARAVAALTPPIQAPNATLNRLT